jgi:hypothetical protein
MTRRMLPFFDSETMGKKYIMRKKCGAFQVVTCLLKSGLRHFDEKRKKTGQICWREKHSVSDLELSSLAGFFAFIWSNLCTRNIQKKITLRGHHDWPDKRYSYENRLR